MTPAPTPLPMPVPDPPPRDLTRTLLAVLLIVGLIAASFWILRPFLLSIAWATMIVVATWPLMLMLQARLRWRALAVALLSCAILLVFVVPLVLALQTLADNADFLTQAAKDLGTARLPPPPAWVASIPLAGARVSAKWAELAASGSDALLARLAPYAADAAQWLAGALGSLGLLAVHFVLTAVLTVIMFSSGEAAREMLLRFGRRLAGARGEGAVLLAGQAIRAVALGIVVTALVQTLLAGIGLALAGVPAAGLLTGAILLLCIAQVGPVIVLAPAVGWLFWHGDTGWGIALLVWTVVVGMLDNVLRPMLIRRGADLPMLLIFGGVIGGLFAFGIVGLFVGPVVLAVTYTLLREWMADAPPPAK